MRNNQSIRDFFRVIAFLKAKAPIYVLTTVISNTIVSVCYNIVLAVILKYVIDAIQFSNSDYLWIAFSIAGISFTFAIIIQPFMQKMNSYCVRYTMKIVRQTLFSKLVHIRVEQYEDMNDGEIMTKLTKNVDSLEDIYFNQIPDLCFTVVHGLIATCLMLYYNRLLGVVAVLLGLTSVFINNIISSGIKKHSEKYQTAYGRIMQNLMDMMSGFVDIKMMRSELHFKKSYEKISGEMKNSENKMDQCKNYLNSSNRFFGHLNDIGLMAFGLFLVFQGYTTIGSVVAVIKLQGNAAYLFQNITSFLAGMKEVLPSARRVFELLDIKTKETSSINHILSETEGNIQIDNLCFHYKDHIPVLQNITIEMKHGELIGIVGKSGNGKTTFAKILLGFYRQQKGKYEINGINTNEMSDHEIQNRISYLDQDSNLFQMSIEENIRLGNLEASKEELEDACKRAGVHEFITNLKDSYDTKINENNDNISGGQRQRIALARALISKKPILIIDEGTSQLDPETEEYINHIIVSLKGKKTVIVITHKENILEFADQIIEFENGKAVIVPQIV